MDSSPRLPRPAVSSVLDDASLVARRRAVRLGSFPVESSVELPVVPPSVSSSPHSVPSRRRRAVSTPDDTRPSSRSRRAVSTSDGTRMPSCRRPAVSASGAARPPSSSRRSSRASVHVDADSAAARANPVGAPQPAPTPASLFSANPVGAPQPDPAPASLFSAFPSSSGVPTVSTLRLPPCPPSCFAIRFVLYVSSLRSPLRAIGSSCC